MSYFGVYTPSKTDIDCDPHVFTEKEQALKVLKANKDARLKVFKNKDEATNYAQTGFEVCHVKYADLKSPSAVVEKAAFRGPTKQELAQFRKTIENDDYDTVKRTIWDNPRYLVNCGDTPTNLKEGYRYNALHVCAISKQPRIAELILQTISNVAFIELLHGKKDPKICQEVSNILLDYYLNMPEKGRCETPLHLAVKYGAVEVVQVLTSYPQCKMLPNLDDFLPKDIICMRSNNPDPDIKEKIANLLEERFYVPVIRSVDNSLPPTIGEPFSPSKMPVLNNDPLSPEVEIQAVAGPMSKEQAQTFRRRWKTPPRVHNATPTLVSSPYISPVKFRHSTPAKSINNNNSASTPVCLSRHALFASRALDLNSVNGSQDSTNGNHADSSPVINTENNNCIQKPSKENCKQPFVPAITPLRQNPLKWDLFFNYREKAASPAVFDGNDSNASDVASSAPVTPLRPALKNRDLFFAYRERVGTPANESVASMNNSILSEKDIAESPGLKERHVKLADTEKGLEVIGRELAKVQNVEWREYWDFLGAFVDIASPQGLKLLDGFLERRNKEDAAKKNDKSAMNGIGGGTTKKRDENLLHNLCSALDQLALSKEMFSANGGIGGVGSTVGNAKSNGTNAASNTPQSTTPYLCVEKSMQVFAKRMTKTILHNLESVTSINDAFLSELKRLKSLICSFKDDTRFLNIVDFTVVHSRFANLIANYLRSSQDIDQRSLQTIKKCFEDIILSSSYAVHRNPQLQCVCVFILEYLDNEADKILPENLKTEKICTETWQNEVKCDCLWETGLSRQSSRKKSRRLFDDDTTSNKPESISNKTDTNGWRQRQNSGSDVSWDEFEEDDKEEEEDIFWSDLGSDNEDDDCFYTPPESPTMLQFEDLDLEDYHVYILGDEPTKRDLDVLNAIFHVEIDKKSHPNIYRWRAAVMQHPNEEMDNFPSPSVVVKKHHRTGSLPTDDRAGAIAKRLFSSPSRSPAPVISIKNKTFANVLWRRRDSTGSSSPGSSSPGSSASKNLSFMNVSDSE